MTILALAVSFVLVAIALLHAYWGFGGLWPARDEAALTATVIGVRGRIRMPVMASCLVVTLALGAAALWLAALSGLVPSPFSRSLLRLGGAALAAIFLLRGVAAYLPFWRGRFAAEPFATNDRLYYGPLCLALGAAILILLLA